MSSTGPQQGGFFGGQSNAAPNVGQTEKQPTSIFGSVAARPATSGFGQAAQAAPLPIFGARVPLVPESTQQGASGFGPSLKGSNGTEISKQLFPSPFGIQNQEPTPSPFAQPSLRCDFSQPTYSTPTDKLADTAFRGQNQFYASKPAQQQQLDLPFGKPKPETATAEKKELEPKDNHIEDLVASADSLQSDTYGDRYTSDTASKTASTRKSKIVVRVRKDEHAERNVVVDVDTTDPDFAVITISNA